MRPSFQIHLYINVASQHLEEQNSQYNDLLLKSSVGIRVGGYGRQRNCEVEKEGRCMKGKGQSPKGGLVSETEDQSDVLFLKSQVYLECIILSPTYASSSVLSIYLSNHLSSLHSHHSEI